MSKFGVPDTARESRDTRAIEHKSILDFGIKTVGRLRRGNRAVRALIARSYWAQMWTRYLRTGPRRRERIGRKKECRGEIKITT
jgi:hypothetical protein